MRPGPCNKHTTKGEKKIWKSEQMQVIRHMNPSEPSWGKHSANITDLQAFIEKGEKECSSDMRTVYWYFH